MAKYEKWDKKQEKFIELTMSDFEVELLNILKEIKGALKGGANGGT